MKVLFVLTPAFNPNGGGVQRTTYKLGKYFSEHEIEVAYFSTSNTGHVKVEFGNLYHAKESDGAKNSENIIELKETLKNFQPDFVINQMPYVKALREELFLNEFKKDYLLFGCLRNSLFNFKSNARDRMQQMMPNPVFKIMDNPLGIGLVKQRHYFKHRKDLKAILDQHDKFILLTPPNREELSFFVDDYKNEKVMSIPNSIPSVMEIPVSKDKIILHVGRLNVQQKRSDLLLKVWEKVYEYLPEWKFVIVGEGPYMNNLKEEIKNKNLPRVKLEGFQKPESYYKRAPIFMMPSAYEGFPNTLIEAQSFGCVPFAFDSYSALSWIVNKEDAILSPAFEPQDMANKIIELAQNENKLELMRQAALKNAKKFTINEVGNIWMKLFEKLS